MKPLLAGLTLSSLALGAWMAIYRPHAEIMAATQATARTPVVVELFTSEGCSSCPPADALLSRLEEQQPIGAAEVIALEEHVDYWDDLGWKDPFSSHEWTSRQYVYSGTLGNGNPYTPQMVVDGSVEFVGSRARQAQQTILEAAGKAKIPVTLEHRGQDATNSESLSVNAGKLEGATKGDEAEVWLAITETGLHSPVTRGENSGQDVHHAPVVRTMFRIGEAKGEGESAFAGNVNVPLRSAWKRENLKAVVFLQEKKSRRILGAAEIALAK